MLYNTVTLCVLGFMGFLLIVFAILYVWTTRWLRRRLDKETKLHLATKASLQAKDVQLGELRRTISDLKSKEAQAIDCGRPRVRLQNRPRQGTGNRRTGNMQAAGSTATGPGTELD